MRVQRNNMRRTEDIQLHILVWRMLLCICMVTAICVIGKEHDVQAAGYDYPIEKTKEVQVLDENYKDAQGVTYTLDEATHTAMVGGESNNDINTSGYKGANDGVCIIPEKVSYEEKEYTVTTLKEKAFESNSMLRVLVIPDTVVELKGANVWTYMDNMQYLYIGKGLNLMQCSMERCIELREVAVSEENPYVKNVDGVIYSKDGKILVYNPSMRPGSAFAEYQVLEGTETIGEGAFKECRYRKVLLPESVKRIESQAFVNCYWLQTLDMSNVEDISAVVFGNDNYSLKSIYLPKGDYTMGWSLINGYYVLNDNPPMRALFLTKGMQKKDWNSSSFSGMPYLKFVAVQDQITTIGKREFMGCSNLETVLLPATLQSLPEKCFSKCTALKKLYIPPSVTTIGEDVLAECSPVIYGEAGSVAEDYALEKGFTFVDVSSHDHSHLTNTTVYEDGYMKITAKYCSECGYARDIQQEIKNEDADLDITNGVYDFQLEKTHDKVVLERNMMDEQGVVYGIDKKNHTASVVRVEDREEQHSIVIPEVVIKDSIEYIVNNVKKNAMASNAHIVSVTLSDAVRTLEDGSLAAKSLKYVYIGAGLMTLGVNNFANDNVISRIWIASGNPQLYVKDRIVYTHNINGWPDCIEFDYTSDESKEEGRENQDITETTTSEETEQPTDRDGNIPQADAGNIPATEDSKTQTTTMESTNEQQNGDKNSLQKPKLKVKKRCTSNGVHYLQLNLKKLSGKYIELYVKKGRGTYKNIKLRSNHIKKRNMQLKIGYKPDGKKLRIKVRTYRKVNGKKIYSEWSKTILVK